jgi:AcrR family transcriptional regulator
MQHLSDFFQMGTEASDKAGRRMRGPVQARSQKRIDAAIAAAERLLEDLGPERISIPEIAAEANVPRATIYQYFPDKYALFAHMAEGQYRRIFDTVAAATAEAGRADWKELVRIAIDAVAGFYNANRIAAILILMGPFGTSDHAAHVEKDRMLANLFRARLGLEKLDRAGDPDRIGLAIQIAFACLRHGYMHEHFISPAIRAEAIRATTTFIAPFIIVENDSPHGS